MISLKQSKFTSVSSEVFVAVDVVAAAPSTRVRTFFFSFCSQPLILLEWIVPTSAKLDKMTP